MKIKSRYLSALFNQILIEKLINWFDNMLCFNNFSYSCERNIIDIYKNSIYNKIIDILPGGQLKNLYFNFKKLIITNQNHKILSQKWNVLWIRSESYCLKEKNGKVVKTKWK